MMRPVVRFWVIVLSLIATVACTGYLLISFWLPDVFGVATQREVRLAVTGIAIVSIGVFTWAAVVLSEPEAEMVPGQEK